MNNQEKVISEMERIIKRIDFLNIMMEEAEAKSEYDLALCWAEKKYIYTLDLIVLNELLN